MDLVFTPKCRCFGSAIVIKKEDVPVDKDKDAEKVNKDGDGLCKHNS